MSDRPRPVWVLCECPSSLTEWERIVDVAACFEAVHVLLRSGFGLSPFLLLGKAKLPMFRFGLWMHLRDQAIPALESDLRSAVAIGLQTIFVGDPAPLPTGIVDRPVVGPLNLVSFLERARRITGAAVRYGVINRASHPADLQLLRRQIGAGCEIAALPSQVLERHETVLREILSVAGRNIEYWVWCRSLEDDVGRQNSLLLELEATDEPFPERLRRHLTRLSVPWSQRAEHGMKEGRHVSTPSI